MDDKNYDKMMEAMRGIKPTPEKPEELTSQIMARLGEQGPGKKGISISGNAGRWTIFIGFRAAMAAAAIILVAFFSFQQWEIMSKVTRLEEEMVHQKYEPAPIEKAENSFANYLPKQIPLNTGQLKKALKGKDDMVVPKSTMIYLLDAIERLEEENRLLKAEIIKQFADSLKKYKNERPKYKSL